MITTILSLLKSLFPFLKEALSVSDELRGSNPKIKFAFLSFVIGCGLIAWIAGVNLERTKIVSSSQIDNLEGRIELLVKRNQEVETDLLEERTESQRLRYQKERANNEIMRLRQRNRELEDTLRKSERLTKELEEKVNACPSSEVEDVYSRLLELHEDR